MSTDVEMIGEGFYTQLTSEARAQKSLDDILADIKTLSARFMEAMADDDDTAQELITTELKALRDRKTELEAEQSAMEIVALTDKLQPDILKAIERVNTKWQSATGKPITVLKVYQDSEGWHTEINPVPKTRKLPGTGRKRDPNKVGKNDTVSPDNGETVLGVAEFVKTYATQEQRDKWSKVVNGTPVQFKAEYWPKWYVEVNDELIKAGEKSWTKYNPTNAS